MSDQSSDESEMEISVAIPLDEDRFLMRECPACEREFRWHLSEEESPEQSAEEEDVAEEQRELYCPYCGKQSAPDNWFTEAQIEFLQANAMHEIGPQLDGIFGGMERDSGFLRVEVDGSLDPGKPEPLEEDLAKEARRVDFSCHPEEPVKVDPGWEKPIHCLICGKTDT
jgi:endogenous inhibitor of DNA gyrase (YacG/DUF329 family)